MHRIFTRLFLIGLFGGIAAVIALIVAVAVTMSSLTGFEAMKSSPNGQMVRVHAADGSVIVSLGPSFGKWLSSNQIPQRSEERRVGKECVRTCGSSWSA